MAEVLFFITAIGTITGAVGVIALRNPFYSVLALVSHLISLALLFLLLRAEFVAAAQVIVYAGAVMVLFLFVIMLLNLGTARSDLRGPSAVAAAIVIAGLLLVELVALWRYTPARLAAEVAQAPDFADPATLFVAGELARQEAEARGVVGAVAAPLFQIYLVPFELTSILLLAAIIGAVVLAKRRI